jgi:hypothetical protein
MSDEPEPPGPAPSPSPVQELLRDLRELTGRQSVYEDLWCGMVPADDTLGELQTGPPVAFADLGWRDQADVLREFIHWGRYRRNDPAWDDPYTVARNISDGLPPWKCSSAPCWACSRGSG